jgi:hypothetical protein
MGRRKAEWTLLAPLGELPEGRVLEEVGRCKQLKNSAQICTLPLSCFQFIQERKSS